jgi:2-polyprenyl-3-methyl-5-hydroxy-6-metoxy-1,4-benzoquinol methylase
MVGSFFSRTTKFEHWNRWSETLRSNPFQQERVRLLKALVPSGVRRILDVGCGDGFFLEVAAREGFSVFGVDSSDAAAKAAKIPFALSNVSAIPFKDNSFDLVLCTEVLENLPKNVLRSALKELQRLSRKYLLIGVPYREEVLNHMSKCGFCTMFFTHGAISRPSLLSDPC